MIRFLYKILVVSLPAKSSQPSHDLLRYSFHIHRATCSVMLLTMGGDDALADTVSFSFFLSNFCNLSTWRVLGPVLLWPWSPHNLIRTLLLRMWVWLLVTQSSGLSCPAPRLVRSHWESAGRLTGESPLPNWDHAVIFIKHQVGSPFA